MRGLGGLTGRASAAVLLCAGLPVIADHSAGADTLPSNCTGTTTITCTFNYNGTDGSDGSPQTFAVPTGMTAITVDAVGTSTRPSPPRR